MISPRLQFPRYDLPSLPEKAPGWRGGKNKEICDNLIFPTHCGKASDVAGETGVPSERPEWAEIRGNAVFRHFLENTVLNNAV